LNAEIDEHERLAARTVVFHKNISDLLSNVENGITQLVDKMQSGSEKANEDLSFTIIINIHFSLFAVFVLFFFCFFFFFESHSHTDEALRLEALMKHVQEKKEVIEQEILDANMHKISKKKAAVKESIEADSKITM